MSESDDSRIITNSSAMFSTKCSFCMYFSSTSCTCLHTGNHSSLMMEENFSSASSRTSYNWKVTFFIATQFLTIAHIFSVGFSSGL
jgi:hypothetical protein